MFKRISNLIQGFLGLFVSGLERKNPEALLEVEKENLREQIAKYNQGLVSHAALCERLMTQIKQNEAEERDLKAKTTANLRAGNRDVAAQQALRLQNVTRQLAEDRAQLEQGEKTYKDLVAARDVAVNAARAKIESLKRSIDDMKVQKAMAELNEMASGMVSSIGGAGDTLDRLQGMVQEERDKAAGRARVARDSVDTGEIKMKQAEQSALAEQALADFAAQEGIALDPPANARPAAEADSPAKTMGPGPESTEQK